MTTALLTNISLISPHRYSGASSAVEGGTNIYPIMAKDEKKRRFLLSLLLIFPAGGNRLFHSLGLLSTSVVTSVL